MPMQNSEQKIEFSTPTTAATASADVGYVTRTAVQAGEELLLEQPLFVTPHWDCEQMKCSNCMLNSFVMCKKCQVFPLCIDCSAHDARDCGFFSGTGAGTAIDKNVLVKNYGAYALLKLLLLLEHERNGAVEQRATCATLLRRAQQLPPQGQTPSMADEEQRVQVLQPLLNSGLLAHFRCMPHADCGEDVNEEAAHLDLLQRLCHVIDMHAFELLNREGDSLKGVYVRAGAHLPHSCLPTVCIAIDELNYNMHVYAATSMPAGMPLYNCYVNPLLSTAQRQQQLRLSRGATALCKCARCIDPSELGTHMSTLRCTQCADGLMLPSIPTDLGVAAAALDSCNWMCTECGASMPAASVQHLLDTISDEFACVAGDLKATESLFEKQASRLHSQHFLLVEMKQHLASLLRAMPLLGVSAEAARTLLQRRVRLCVELLPLIRTVQPGISKLYAIALYEHLLAVRQLTELERRQQLFVDMEYGHNLLQAKHLAMEALDLLHFEPPNSPEGHLAQRLAYEAKQITERLQQLNITEV